MKLIVELDDEFYNHIQNDHKYFLEDGEELYSIVQNAIPIPDNATNGEILKTLFPTGIPSGEDSDSHLIKTDFSWWKAPYKKGGE